MCGMTVPVFDVCGMTVPVMGCLAFLHDRDGRATVVTVLIRRPDAGSLQVECTVWGGGLQEA